MRKATTPTLYLYPAYGRTYPHASAMYEDWKAGKDFKNAASTYTSVRDLDILRNMGFKEILISSVDGTSQVGIPLYMP